jgi:transcription elongation factor Elf1
MSKSKIAQYMQDAGGDEVRAAELVARDLMRGDPSKLKSGYTAENAARAGLDALDLDLHQIATDLLTARLEAWSEGRSEMALSGREIEDHAVLRCPECCSEEVDPEDQQGEVRCGNCGERFERGEVYVTVADAEAFAAARGRRRMKVLTPGADELPTPFAEEGEEYEVTPLEAIPPRVERLLDELDAVVEPGATLTLARDWEGTIIGAVDGDENFTALYFTDDGRIARGTINLPPYFEKVEELPPY